MKTTAMILSVSLLCSGCMTGTLAKGEKSEMAEILKAAGKDSSSYCLSTNLMTPWGSEKASLSKTGILNGTVTCNDTGLTVTTPAPVKP